MRITLSLKQRIYWNILISSYFFIFQELVANAGSDRNWKGMFIATLVILAVFGLIILSVIWMTPPEDTGLAGETISFEDFLNRKLVGETFNGTWISGKSRSLHSLIKLLCDSLKYCPRYKIVVIFNLRTYTHQIFIRIIFLTIPI